MCNTTVPTKRYRLEFQEIKIHVVEIKNNDIVILVEAICKPTINTHCHLLDI